MARCPAAHSLLTQPTSQAIGLPNPRLLHSAARCTPPESRPHRLDNTPPRPPFGAASATCACAAFLALAVLSRVVPPRGSPALPLLAPHWRPWPTHLHHSAWTSVFRTRNCSDRLFLRGWPPCSLTHCTLAWRVGAPLATIAVPFCARAQPFNPRSPVFVGLRLASLGFIPTFSTYLLSASSLSTARVASIATASPLHPIFHQRVATAPLATSLLSFAGAHNSSRCGIAHRPGLNAAVTRDRR
jgi:hypothetical protein